MSFSRTPLMVARRFLSTARVCNEKAGVKPVYFKVKDAQKVMRENSGPLVHVIGGGKDKAMYYFTVACTTVVMGQTFYYLYSFVMRGR